jgi:flagellar biosynthesis protein FliQ
VIASVAALVREGFLLVLLLTAPFLVAAVLAGLLSGLLAAFTRLQDPAVALAPRVVAVAAAIVLFAPAIGHQLVAFTARLWPLVANIGTG